MFFHDSPEHAAFRAELRRFSTPNSRSHWNMRNDRDHITPEQGAFTS